MKRFLIALVTLIISGTASAAVPVFAAKCPSGINVDTNARGQVYINGKVATLIKRPNGQITAQSGGVYVDITPRGNSAPTVTSTARDKSFGQCEILSFAPPRTASTPPARGATSSERAGQGQFDARGPVSCAMRPGQAMRQCQAAVARDGGGTATVVVTRPDGRKRFIYFEKGRAIGADLSQADGSQHFLGTKGSDGVYRIEAGNERYEFAEALVFGG